MSNINVLGTTGKHDTDKLTSKERALEFFKCRQNPFYFIYNYVYLEEIGGKLKYSSDKMHYKMKRVIKSVYNFKFAILMASRQLGKSSLAACLLEWANNFYPNNKAMILNMSKDASLENLLKIKFIHSNLPTWLRVSLNYDGKRKTYIEYSHNSIIKTFYPSSAIDPNTLGRSLTVPCLYIDEAAFIRHFDEAYASAQPALIRAQEQAQRNNYPYFTLITSTPNGTIGIGEYFHKLWSYSVNSDELFIESSDKLETEYSEIVNDSSKNGYVRVKYHWSEDPTKDDDWYSLQCRKLNFDKRKINQELDLLFVGGSNCIFNDDFLERLKPKKPINRIDIGLNFKLDIYTEFDQNNFYLVGIDSAKSIVGDFCAVEIYDFLNFNQTAEFHSRVGSLMKFKDIIKQIVDYMYKYIGERFFLCIENNYAHSIIEQLQIEDRAYERRIYTPVNAPLERNVPVDRGSIRPRQDGINTNSRTKDLMIGFFNSFIIDNPECIHSSKLIDEINVIERKSNGSISAQTGHHDDLFMASCFCAYVKKIANLEISPFIGHTGENISTGYISNLVKIISDENLDETMILDSDSDINSNSYNEDVDYFSIV